MALGHKGDRRPGRRAFQPTIDGRLETRVLLSHASVIKSHTAAGGQAVVITNTSGQQFFVSVTEGTIRAFPAPGGRASFVVDGTSSNTLMEINQIIPPHKPTRGAHTFNSTLGAGTGVLNIAAINVTSGYINSIEGYHTAILSGPISIGGASQVNRIALLAIQAGGSIGVGGDLNTLDVYNSAIFSGSTGLFVARDLNWLEVGGDLTFSNGANLTVGRGVGQIFQLPKGSGNGGQGIYVNGNLTIGANDVATVGTNIGPFGVLVNGNFSGGSRFTIDGIPLTSNIPISSITGAPTIAVHGKATA